MIFVSGSPVVGNRHLGQSFCEARCFAELSMTTESGWFLAGISCDDLWDSKDEMSANDLQA